MKFSRGCSGLVLLLALFIKSGDCVPPYVSCPDPDPIDHTVFFPHENNCTEFYRCDHGSALLQYCPGGLHWNPKLDTCDFPWDAGCAPEGGPGGSGSGTEEGTGGGSEGSCGGGSGGGNGNGGGGGGNENGNCPEGTPPNCPYPDPAYSVFFPHPNDCHWFYHCSNGVAYCKVCPAGLHWNTELDTCDWPWNAGCVPGGGGENPPPSGCDKPSKESRCPIPQPPFNVYFNDPRDCTIFYECANGVAVQQKCPAGLYFNPANNVCDYPENVKCCNPGPGTTPGNPGQNTTPGHPGENTTPGNPGQNTTPGNPGENTTPGNPGQNTTPGNPGGNTTPGNPGHNTTPGNPGEITTPDNPGQNTTPGNPGENTTPGNPGQNTTPGNPGEITTPGNPGQNTTPGNPGQNTTPGNPGHNPTPGRPGGNNGNNSGGDSSSEEDSSSDSDSNESD